MNNTLKAFLAVFAFAGVFLSGGIVGGVITVRVAREHFRHMEQARDQLQQERQQQELAQAREQLMEENKKELDRAVENARSYRPGRLPPGPEQFSAQLMRRFSTQLDLTPEQREKILPMVNAAAENMRRLRRDTTHNFEVTLDQLEDQIAAILTPAQRDRFNEMIQSQRDRIQKYREQQQLRMERQREMGQP